MNKAPETYHRIRFKDCDPHGHLNNTRFIEYLLEAREDQIREHYKLDLFHYAEERKLAWMLVKNEIAYLREALRNEIVLIRTTLIQSTPKSITVEYQMWNESKNQLKALLWSRFLHIDMKIKKTIAHPEDIQELLDTLTNPIDEITLDDRIVKLHQEASLNSG